MTAPLGVALLVVLLVGATGGPAAPRGRLRRVAAAQPSLALRPGLRAPVRSVGLLVALAAAVVAAAVAVGPAGVLLGPLAGLAVHRWRVVAARRRRASALRTALPGACRAFAAELRAGQPAPEALGLAARDAGGELARLLEPAVRGARLGGDVAAMLRAAAGEPGAARLRVLAAAWQVSADSGASLAMLAERLAVALADEERHRRLVAAQLAGPRASARLLAALPVVGVLLGVALGADPLRLLLHTPWGLACLTAAVALDALGLLWTDRLAASAARTSG